MDYINYERGKIKPYPSSSTKLEKLNWFKQQFRPHFEIMAVSPAKDMIEHPNGAMPAFLWITCAIDWLAGFMYGEKRKPTGDVKKSFTDFIKIYFDSNPEYAKHSENLYTLRNGLIHNYTIKEQNNKREYCLARQGRGGDHFKVMANGQTILNLDDLFADFESAKDKYFDAVEQTPSIFDKFEECYDREGFLRVI